MTYFIPCNLDCCEIPESFPTQEEAIGCAEEMLEGLRDVAFPDGWHPDMDKFKITNEAGETLFIFKRVNVIKRPDDISENTDYFWPTGCDYLCGYELQEVLKE